MLDAEHQQITEDRLSKLELGEKIGAAVMSKTATWAVSIAVLIVSIALSIGGVLYFVGDKLLAFQSAASDLKHLHEDHEHCVQELSDIKARVAVLESKSTASN